MKAIYAAIDNWFKAHGGFSHVVAAVYFGAVAAYAAVPAFQNVCNSLYGSTPSWLHELILAAVGLIAWYKNTRK